MFYSPTYHTVVFLVVSLVVVFLFLLSYTFWTRTKKRYWKRYESKFRTYFLPLLFEFTEEATDPDEADVIIGKLTKRSKDIGFFLELLNELTEILKGEELEKLNWIIRHPLFFEFYTKKLFSFSIENQLLACIYFGKSSFEDDQIITRLNALSRSGNTKLAYGATKTLQSSVAIEVRKNALIRFMKRSDCSDLMAGEIIHLFYREGFELHEESTRELKNILLRNDIPNDRKKIIIIYFSQQNFFEYSLFLLDYLRDLSYSAETKPLILSLLQALGNLEVTDAESVIRSFTKSGDGDIRLASIKALSQLGGDANLVFIYRLISDIDFSVRKKVIEILVQHPKSGHRLLEKFIYNQPQLVNQIAVLKNPSIKQVEIVRKISSITTGIRILSANKISSSAYHLKYNQHHD